MTSNKDYEKIVIHASREMYDRLSAVSEKNKLSVASTIREAIKKYLEDNEKKK